MLDDTREVNFDGLVGPTYNYAALAPGNLASRASRGRPSNPKAAALEGLAKAEALMELGAVQALLPPLVRPDLAALLRIGLLTDPGLLEAGPEAGNDREIAAALASAAEAAPHLLAACFSGSNVWTANAATVSPSADTADRKVHLTPANMVSAFHRSLEAAQMHAILAQVFADQRFFTVHPPLPATDAFADEGAANHMRLALRHGDPAVNVFVHGREGDDEWLPQHRYRPRQTRLASQAIARLHRLDPSPDRTIFIRQGVEAINAGAFHNDVIATSHLDLLLYHERAFAETARAVSGLALSFAETAGAELRLLEVREQSLSLEQAVASYLFNSQIVTADSGEIVLVAPRECRTVPAAARLLRRIAADDASPIERIVHVDVGRSMRNGGGPACLRLRVVLSTEERKAVLPGIFLDRHLLKTLRRFVEKDYPSAVEARMFAEPDFLRKSFRATRTLYDLLGLALPRTPAEARARPHGGKAPS